ncbi:Ger(x)C family spore germination protein [Clostridium ganghwense]|uniref:Ger(X)C family spore germination protein n=1 Tax=Clostridium ganghwense TaxID=312089 RepID=A0ABT4CLE0_9CLOT|nr:Ger(x)C family spore germination protein [Clostridium ganghwense]MCY6369852.1 Ger(x)C family spore germination protein [Clostridium ganghwense]
MKCKKIIPLILICCLMSGCWDKVEIDRKSFISTIAIDEGKDIDKEKELKEIKPGETFEEENFKKITITYGFPDISELGPEKGGTGKEKFIKTDAYSMQDAFTQMASKTSRSIHFGHVKLLILSEKLMEYPETLKEIFDYLERKPCLNKMMEVVVAKGRAEDYVKYQPVMEKNIESYITGLMENSTRNSSILPMSLNELLILLYQNGNAIIPSIYFDKLKDEIDLSGVAVIKDYKLEGYLEEKETSALEILRGKIQGGKQTIIKNGHPVDYEISGTDRRIELVDDDIDKLKVRIDIKLEGVLRGYILEGEVFSKNDISEFQNNFNDSIEKQCEKVVRITQDKFSVDPIGIREYLERFHPSVYKKVKDNWDEAYKNADIDVNVQTRIRRIGVTK